MRRSFSSAKGCCALNQGELIIQPGFDVSPIDTTGAGDTFCGVLGAALSQGESMAQAMRRACAAAALACTRMGAQSSIPGRAEVDALLAQQSADDARLATLRSYVGA